MKKIARRLSIGEMSADRPAMMNLKIDANEKAASGKRP